MVRSSRSVMVGRDVEIACMSKDWKDDLSPLMIMLLSREVGAVLGLVVPLGEIIARLSTLTNEDAPEETLLSATGSCCTSWALAASDSSANCDMISERDSTSGPALRRPHSCIGLGRGYDPKICTLLSLDESPAPGSFLPLLLRGTGTRRLAMLGETPVICSDVAQARTSSSTSSTTTMTFSGLRSVWISSQSMCRNYTNISV